MEELQKTNKFLAESIARLKEDRILAEQLADQQRADHQRRLEAARDGGRKLQEQIQLLQNNYKSVEMELHQIRSNCANLLDLPQNASCDQIANRIIMIKAEQTEETVRKRSAEIQAEQTAHASARAEQELRTLKNSHQLTVKKHDIANAQIKQQEEELNALRRQLTEAQIKLRAQQVEDQCSRPNDAPAQLPSSEENLSTISQRKSEEYELEIENLRSQLGAAEHMLKNLEADLKLTVFALDSAKQEDSMDKATASTAEALKAQLNSVQDQLGKTRTEYEQYRNKVLEDISQMQRLHEKRTQQQLRKIAEYEALLNREDPPDNKKVEQLHAEIALLRKKRTLAVAHFREQIEATRLFILEVLGWRLELRYDDGQKAAFTLAPLYALHDGALCFIKNESTPEVQYELRLSGSFATKWESQNVWRSQLQAASGQFPPWLAKLLLQEFQGMKENSFNRKLRKNYYGKLVRLAADSATDPREGAEAESTANLPIDNEGSQALPNDQN